MKLILAAVVIAVLQLAGANPVKRECTGCVEEGQSYAVGESWVKACNTYTCAGDNNNITITDRGCEDLMDSSVCYAVNETWVGLNEEGDFGHCLTYTCVQPADNNVLPYPSGVDPKCRYKNICLGHGESVPIANCKTLTCSVDGNVVNFAYSDTPGCTGSCLFNNVTYEAGQDWVFDCYNYTCTGPNTYDRVRDCCPVSFNGEVVKYNIGSFQIDGIPCNHYYCDVELGFYEVVKGCYISSHDECVLAPNEWNNGCVKYQCVDFGSYASLEFISGGCNDTIAGVCRDVNETWTRYTNNTVPYNDTGYCYHMQCQEQATSFSIAQVSSECRLGNQCYGFGVVKDYRRDESPYDSQCLTVTCDVDGLTSFRAICRDADGGCHPYGTVGFPFVINDHRCENCTCNPAGNSVSYYCSDY